jgi:hypothetical protein
VHKTSRCREAFRPARKVSFSTKAIVSIGGAFLPLQVGNNARHPSRWLISTRGAGRVDPRLVFLLRAAARFELVEAGQLCLDEAFDGLIFALCWGGRA